MNRMSITKIGSVLIVFINFILLVCIHMCMAGVLKYSIVDARKYLNTKIYDRFSAIYPKRCSGL